MLKRAWLVVSVFWTTVWYLGLGGFHEPVISAVFIIGLPWFLGPVILYTFRYIVQGNFSRPAPRTVRGEREHVTAKWVDDDN